MKRKTLYYQAWLTLPFLPEMERVVWLEALFCRAYKPSSQY
ncbi:MAG: hypothetical protein Q4D62_11705 [Planctomycetia bacterium]|nr:hypothetical protein [Planctomycetia bacterium]